MNAEFLKAIAPERFTILGQRLEVFSLGHAVILARLGLDSLANPGELALAVVVCAGRADEAEETIRSRWLPWRLRLWRWRVGRFDFAAKRKLFLDYTRAHGELPTVLHRGDGSTLLPGAPFLWHVKVTLQSKLNYTPAEAFNAPLGRALWDYFTLWENEGEAEIIGESAREMFEIANWMHADLVKEGRVLQNN